LKKQSKRNKYNVRKVKPVYNDITFDSKLELNHYKLFEEYDEITVTELQPYFLLMEPFEYFCVEKNKIRKYGKFSYKADFLLEIKGLDKPVVWESKGMVKPEFAIRKKVWYSLYGEDYYYIMSKSVKHAKALLDEILKRK
jgi:hypothetical protein